MIFRNYCYEKWYQYQEETCAHMRGRGYNYDCLEWPEYFAKHKWWLRRMYRLEHETLQKKWRPVYVGTIPPNSSDALD